MGTVRHGFEFLVLHELLLLIADVENPRSYHVVSRVLEAGGRKSFSRVLRCCLYTGELSYGSEYSESLLTGMRFRSLGMMCCYVIDSMRSTPCCRGNGGWAVNSRMRKSE